MSSDAAEVERLRAANRALKHGLEEVMKGARAKREQLAADNPARKMLWQLALYAEVVLIWAEQALTGEAGPCPKCGGEGLIFYSRSVGSLPCPTCAAAPAPEAAGERP